MPFNYHSLTVNLVSGLRESVPPCVIFCVPSLCTFIVVALSQLQQSCGPLQVSFYSGSNRDAILPLKEGNSRWLVCLTLSLWNPFSGLYGPNMLRPRGMCPGRVPLLCGMGRARMWEPQGLLHGPVLWTRSFPGRHRDLQLWSQLDRPWLLYRWVLPSDESKHWQDFLSHTSADLALITKQKKSHRKYCIG